ncbi:hypothetical protein SCHPADRAFT_725577 [Schizopora paradoxa]|uniref:Uncharacterized protein n=1 Tax=Schizopora paradoxa TaxID=27342 RepID=A0A0H2RKY4_9AGAM|nr:hypothetical protein SCHPADRAFT_725577 [Schizopora paradoxa]
MLECDSEVVPEAKTNRPPASTISGSAATSTACSENFLMGRISYSVIFRDPHLRFSDLRRSLEKDDKIGRSLRASPQENFSTSSPKRTLLDGKLSVRETRLVGSMSTLSRLRTRNLKLNTSTSSGRQLGCIKGSPELASSTHLGILAPEPWIVLGK